MMSDKYNSKAWGRRRRNGRVGVGDLRANVRRNGSGEPTEGEDGRSPGRRPVVWFEVEDFLRYFDHFRNPTGLQRVPFEIFAEAENSMAALDA